MKKGLKLKKNNIKTKKEDIRESRVAERLATDAAIYAPTDIAGSEDMGHGKCSNDRCHQIHT